MTDAAIIAGSLVDAKNVNTHKVMRLIIDVPAENALKVIAAFGWPTMVNPVHVAVARLTEGKEGEASARQEGQVSDPRSSSDDTPPRLTEVVNASSSAGAERGHKSPAQIAGYLCTLPLFWRFLQEKFSAEWDRNLHPSNEETAKQCVYDICAVTSRRELTDKNTEWHALQLAFRLWQNHPELEDAPA